MSGSSASCVERIKAAWDTTVDNQLHLFGAALSSPRLYGSAVMMQEDQCLEACLTWGPQGHARETNPVIAILIS